jgi:hypothetical protein
MVIKASAETVLYFLDIFEGILTIALLVTAIICARCIIKAVKTTIKPKGYPHKYVHPLPDPADRRNAYRCSDPPPLMAEQSGSIKGSSRH